MAISKHTPALFTEGLSDPRLRQFRMRRLQVHNWGTFNGLTEVPIAERGFLFVGRSGSGKSTLLDAMSALLVPPAIVDFNAAAREAERSGRDRNLVSYVRGAWADQQDRGTGEIATQYLRKGATWTALVLEYRAGDGRVVSLVRLFWIAGNGTAAADVRKHYLIAERPFDVAKDLGGFDLDLRKLKQKLGDVHHFDSFTGFAERFRNLLGIDNDMALRLLHKTQSAKNLGDLNVFLRDFMLDTPRTFDASERLVSDFAELDAAHQAVVTARRQVETLLPARELHAELKAMNLQRADEETLKLGLDSFRESRLQQLLEKRLQDIEVRHRGLLGEETQRRQTLANHEEHLGDLELQRRQQGGERIEELEREQGRAQAERDRRQSKREQARHAADALQDVVPEDAHGFAQLINRAQGELDNRQQAAAALDDAITERLSGKQDDTRRFGEVRAELEAMERNPSSIPAPLQKLRSRMAEETGVPEAALPFVGELIQVRQGEGAWQGAIERVLFGFAQSLLVEDRHYNEVNAWVNRTHLGMRLTFYRVRRNDDAFAREPSARSLLHKLEFRDSVFEPWLRRELGKRYDYECVDAKQLRDVDRGISREGQVKHPGDRFEKDDRSAINDRRRWLLGFNNRDKLALFHKEAQELGKRIAACDEDVARLRGQRDRDNERRLACNQLVNFSWEEVDVATAIQRLQDIESALRELREGNADLARLAQQIDLTRADIAQARRTYEDTRVELIQIARERDKLDAQRQRSRALVLPALGVTQAAGLQQRLDALGGLSLETLEAHMREISKGINESLAASQQDVHRVETQLVACFRRFAQAWPEESGDFTVSVASADDFLARLQRLERDGLPQHEERFFDLLQNQSKNNLLALQRHSAEARKSIGQRLDEVNASLEQVPFNRGTLLTIELSDRRLPEVLEFHQQLRDVLSHHQTEEREVAEAQFAVLRALVKRLGSQEGEDKRWRENVLDVRLHVEFIGVELDAATRQQVEIYRSGAGKSGGQRQKLATTCLAAALRYQLGGADGQLPSYAAVVLDEAFDKADNEFTALAMNIFDNFGFQMVVATPLKSVMTLEPFIGGACFVEISGRHDSGVLLIEYDEEGRRLKLPERARTGETAAAPPALEAAAVDSAPTPPTAVAAAPEPEPAVIATRKPSAPCTAAKAAKAPTARSKR